MGRPKLVVTSIANLKPLRKHVEGDHPEEPLFEPGIIVTRLRKLLQVRAPRRVCVPCLGCPRTPPNVYDLASVNKMHVLVSGGCFRIGTGSLKVSAAAADRWAQRS